MTATLKLNIERVLTSRLTATDLENLPFGMVYTDHMFMCDFENGRWQNARIIPFSYLPMSPASPAIHYGQSIFEGMKAHRSKNDEILLFRPHDHWKRLNISAERMCMPLLPENIFMDGLRELISLDRDWVPAKEGSSLYIRPFMFSADEYIGIRPSQRFTFMIILSPTAAYYAAPVRVKIEEHYTRAVAGGTGFAKAGGNYGGAIYPAKLAQDQGFQQLIWTDGKEHRYIEESGTMNVMFVVDDVLITPALSDSILAGITRDSVLTLARSWDMNVEERKIEVSEIIDAARSNRLKEAFGVGTAARIAPISAIGFREEVFDLPPVETRTFSQKVVKALTAIQYGAATDDRDWIWRI